MQMQLPVQAVYLPEPRGGAQCHSEPNLALRPRQNPSQKLRVYLWHTWEHFHI
jgi:hypothetical protein